MGVEGLTGDPPSEIRQIVNGHLDRPIRFEYLTCEVDGKAGSTKRVAAIVVPDSRRRPHVASREIKERLNNRDVFWLREREVWVRKTGGREFATADDLDTIYEGKLRRLVDDQVRPLQERIERLEGDLREHRSAMPELGFGLSDLDGSGPSPLGQPYAILGNLIDAGWIHGEIEWARKQARSKKMVGSWGIGSTIGEPTAGDYDEYALALETWLAEHQDLLLVEFVLVNTGRVPAEDVEVVLEVLLTYGREKSYPSDLIGQ